MIKTEAVSELPLRAPKAFASAALGKCFAFESPLRRRAAVVDFNHADAGANQTLKITPPSQEMTRFTPVAGKEWIERQVERLATRLSTKTNDGRAGSENLALLFKPGSDVVHAPHRQHVNHVQSLTRSEAAFGTVGKDFRNLAGFELALHAAPEIRAK